MVLMILLLNVNVVTGGGSNMKKLRFTFDIDEDLHTKFKLWCVKNNKSMGGMMAHLIAEFLNHHNDQNTRENYNKSR